MSTTSMSRTDNDWQVANPEGYCNYYKVYGLSVSYLMLYFFKHIRRHKWLEYAFFDKSGTETSSYVFRMDSNGRVSINNDLHFNCYMEAWQYYQNLIYQEFIA